MQENTETPMQVYADLHPEKRDWKSHLLSMMEQGGEYDMGPYKRTIMDWTRGQRNRHPVRTIPKIHPHIHYQNYLHQVHSGMFFKQY